MRRILRALTDIITMEEDPALRKLPSPKRFRELLDRERARAERSSQPLSLLSLGVHDRVSGRSILLHLARKFRSRLRITDQPGWLSRRQLGVILPNTPPSGAWTLAEDLCLTLPEGMPQPECHVYAYPADWEETEPWDSPEEPAKSSGKGRPARSMESLFSRRVPVWKRAIDIFGAGAGLIILSPLLAVVAIAIKRESPGPIFFTQLRSGLGGKPFRIYKFRSMVSDAEALKQGLMSLNERDGPAFKLAKDPRVTPMGRWLRATSIDELPQLWNVLKGDMSLVGPRPLPCNEAQACDDWQRRRQDLPPGLTCTWQLWGRKLSFNDWMRMDAAYIRSLSFGGDLQLILRTFSAVVLRRNE